MFQTVRLSGCLCARAGGFSLDLDVVGSRVRTYLLIDEDGEADVARLLDLLGRASLFCREAGHCCFMSLLSAGKRSGMIWVSGEPWRGKVEVRSSRAARREVRAGRLPAYRNASSCNRTASLHILLQRFKARDRHDEQMLWLDKPAGELLSLQGRRVAKESSSERGKERASALN